jgi:hypothetical protein
LVFIPKCGKKVLTKAIAEGLKQIICDICNKNTQGIMAMEVMPDAEMLNVVTKLYIVRYSSPIKGENVNIS